MGYCDIKLFMTCVIICTVNLIEASTCKCCECGNSNLLIPPGYDKFKTPLEDEEKPTYVYLNIDIMDIDEILEEKMEYSMQFYVNEYWKDRRLNKTYFGRQDKYRVPREWVPDLWVPDTIFENSKGGWVYPLSVPNMVVEVHLFDYLHRFTRYAMKVTCAMDLRIYPMDTQNCFLIITSLAYDDSKMIFKWLHEREEGNLDIEDLTLARFRPLKYNVASITPGTKSEQLSRGNFTSLYANFTFVRHLSSHLMNVYIPSGLVVVLAFLTFWLNVRSVPARVALGLTSLLTLSTQASQARTNLPPINYLTAMDIWLFTCMILNFLSLIEYGLVYHLYNEKMRRRKNYALENIIQAKWAKHTRILCDLKDEGNKDDTEKSPSKEFKTMKSDKIKSSTTMEFEEDTQLLDRISRILFPLVFLIFSLVYWIHFLRSRT